jgi:hypothetical protein
MPFIGPVLLCPALLFFRWGIRLSPFSAPRAVEYVIHGIAGPVKLYRGPPRRTVSLSTLVPTVLPSVELGHPEPWSVDPFVPADHRGRVCAQDRATAVTTRAIMRVSGFRPMLCQRDLAGLPSFGADTAFPCSDVSWPPLLYPLEVAVRELVAHTRNPAPLALCSRRRASMASHSG